MLKIRSNEEKEDNIIELSPNLSSVDVMIDKTTMVSFRQDGEMWVYGHKQGTPQFECRWKK